MEFVGVLLFPGAFVGVDCVMVDMIVDVVIIVDKTVTVDVAPTTEVEV
jgi:hypothetical protein